MSIAATPEKGGGAAPLGVSAKRFADKESGDASRLLDSVEHFKSEMLS